MSLPDVDSMKQSARKTKKQSDVFLEIIEQPARKAIRFRYECEGRLAGSIPGANSTAEHKTYPTIRIANYTGRAVVVVSCVTSDMPYRAHPHRLVGKDGCIKGVCTVEISNETSMQATFNNLGIQCVKKKEIESALKLREEIRVDPFKNGFKHRLECSQIDLSSVRLCFQAFLQNDDIKHPKFNVPIAPIVSDPINDKKGGTELVICKLSDCSASVSGGRGIILLCEKVTKEDIKVRFFENSDDGTLTWEDFGLFSPLNVHKQVAISFKVPKYYNEHITKPQKVYIQLHRPSDNVFSEPLPFEYLPKETDPIVYKRKRQEIGDEARVHIDMFNKRNLKAARFNANNLKVNDSTLGETLGYTPNVYYNESHTNTTQNQIKPKLEGFNADNYSMQAYRDQISTPVTAPTPIADLPFTPYYNQTQSNYGPMAYSQNANYANYETINYQNPNMQSKPKNENFHQWYAHQDNKFPSIPPSNNQGQMPPYETTPNAAQMEYMESFSNTNISTYLDAHPINSSELINMLGHQAFPMQDLNTKEAAEAMTNSFTRLTTNTYCENFNAFEND